ncbi:hypothetical protein M427DRAFT_52370 [Gonapodya prolifera JEL478]|uniref:RING-type domain-containing protein n=1 Tax=Gonapodya prolifera (strain JEL478) TaxID=1344416 RepID=A0A139ATQ9_GONPJ|nr:hypothetical protein M427DRAFT_52370 [Gonapodya prolifera JEL478]|eukprot:KXS20112.1 hypothetical protein M427DRAFT_52370 [Gonapodya prolifera JEL478]
MGLCKCRRVTNLFCFEHRKNVCEHCIVADHNRCVVRSYLAWLQDSDYEPACLICKQPLDDGGDLVRLACLDLFHAACIDDMCAALPDTTAPAGYACPACNSPIIPPDASTSPIAEALRKRFENAEWARHVLPRKPPVASDPSLDAPPDLPPSPSTHPPSAAPAAPPTLATSIPSQTPSLAVGLTSPVARESPANGAADVGPGGVAVQIGPGGVDGSRRQRLQRDRDADDDKYGKSGQKGGGGSWSFPRLTPRRLLLPILAVLTLAALYQVFFAPSPAPLGVAGVGSGGVKREKAQAVQGAAQAQEMAAKGGGAAGVKPKV